MKPNSMYFIKTILKEGKWFFIIPFLVLIFICCFTVFTWYTTIILLLALFIIGYTIYFLRPPKNFPVENDDLIYCSADGKIIDIEHDVSCPYDESSQKYHKVIIFMHVANMHWNQAPINGEITFTQLHKGKFKNAFNIIKTWQDNEHQVITIENKEKKVKIVMAMIAGLIARRIRFFAKIKQSLKQGDILGLIRYGSANVIYIPTTFYITVQLGQKVRAGKTILATRG
jgi:phosphatidylserine decarboxylase